MQGKLRALGCAAALALPCLLLAVGDAGAQPAPGGPPAGARPNPNRMPHPSKDPSAAPSGAYKLDPNHASIIIRVLHEGTSYSTFRFNTTSGVLAWDAAHPEKSTADIKVDTKSLVTPVAGFADRLTGDGYLNSDKFPQAEFVTTSIRRTGPTTGEITGNLTLLGQTHPITVQAQLVGIGGNARGVPTIGFQATGKFKRSDFGLTVLPGIIGDDIELLIDADFNHQS